ncbi:MAG: response regulator transcription factor [Bacteroidales bacterium]|nr:response regulator transcription factor [Bacteroidales bacterium]
MNRINCLIVDDEPAALELLESYIGKVYFLTLVKKCQTAIEAMKILEENQIDLLFLDIHMPGVNGIQLLKSLINRPAVIFTTGYREYAFEGFENDAVDFLLKPFDFDRFLKAVNKAGNLFQKTSRQPEYSPERQRFIFVKADYKLVKINVDDILYVEGLKDYIKIFTRQKLILTLMSMSAIEEKLPSEAFFRVHRSYIIAVGKIDSVSRHRVIIGDKFIPVSIPYRNRFYTYIDKST